MRMGKQTKTYMMPAELRKIREKFGETQREMAARLCVVLRSYVAYENGTTKIPGPVAVAARCLESKLRK